MTASEETANRPEGMSYFDGRGTATVDIVLTDEAGRRTCSAPLTCIVRDA